jgi:apolipoprotein D and lipocalin family protein
MKTFIAISILLLGLSTAEAFHRATPIRVVESIDLSKFLGKWYEIAVIPYFWERGCVATNANYSLRPDGRVDVFNICNEKNLEGKIKTGHGVAVADPTSNAKLKVSFFEPFWANYWIIDLGKNYEYAVTANPNRKYLWILSRTPHMDERLYNEILARAFQQGFDTSKLIKTLQP